MLPAIIIGSAIGTFINIILPEIILDICIIIFLAYLATSIAAKGIRIFKMESKKFAAEKIAIKKMKEEGLKSLNLKHACVGTEIIEYRPV